MKELLIKKLILSDEEGFNSLFIDECNEDINKLSISQLESLLKINNKKVRLEAIEAITCPLIINSHSYLIDRIISIYSCVSDAQIASWLTLNVNSKNIIENSEFKYLYLLSSISAITDAKKASHISNIFWNRWIYTAPTKTFINFMIECLKLSNEELEQLENKIYDTTKELKLILK